MRILKISVKFSPEDELYTVKQIKQETKCNICEGTGRINFNEKDMRCPECNGVGKFILNKRINVVCEEPYKISSTDIKLSSNGQANVKYRGYCGITKLNRSESTLFTTKEEAQKHCDMMNREKKFIKINDISIQESYSSTIPSLEKIQSKLEFRKENGRFENEIILDGNDVLQDGYITYLLYKLLNIKFVKVVVE